MNRVLWTVAAKVYGWRKRIAVPLLVATIAYWTTQVAYAAGVMQVGEDVLANPIVVSGFALLGNAFVATFVTGALRRYGITLGVKPERLVYWCSFASAIALNVAVGLPEWIADAGENTYVLSWLAWAKSVQVTAQTLYEAGVGKLLPGPDPQPEG